MQRLTIRFFLIPLACLVCAPAVFAQTGKLVAGGMEAFGRAAAAETIVKSGARSLPGAAAAYPAGKAVQLQFQFPGEPVQLKLSFPEENRSGTSNLLPIISPSAPDLSLSESLLPMLEKQVKEASVKTLPSGERVRVVALEAKHFKKTHKLNSTIGHYASIEKNTVVLQNANGQRVTVYKNDRLRYFSDLGKVCPAGSYLMRYENGQTTFRTPEEASKSLKEAYENVYRKLHKDEKVLDFAFVNTSYQVPSVKSLALLFTEKPFGTKVYTLDRHPLNQELVQVAVLDRGVVVPGLPDLNTGSMVVLYRDGTFDVHPANRVPPVLKDKVDALRSKQISSAPALTMGGNGRIVSRPVTTTVKTYDSQAQLARDLHASGAPGRRYTSALFGDAIAYEIPVGIYYQPAGRAAKLLDPSEQVVMYYPSKDDGQLVPRDTLTNGWFTPVK